MLFNSPIEKIKQRLDIIEVLSEYLQLKKTGGNYKAVCPFHHEKTPSFMASQEKQIWHCFGCGKGGDIFSFVQEIEGMEFPEALRVLAKKANVVLTTQDPKLSNQKTRILDILKISADWFSDQLLKNTVAQQYLIERKVTKEAQAEWQLGFAPEAWELLSQYLLSKIYTEEEIFQAGLAVKKEKGSGYYDRFRGRIMFPIKDVHGNIVGFTARLLREDPEKKVGKYINTPQTMVYDKSQVIYGLDKAKTEIKKQDSTIIVEGNMDAITCRQAGFTNVVASSGTAFTERQMQLLKRYSPNLILAFDMDLAGGEAAKRSIELAWQMEMNVKVLTLPDKYKDPDECLKKDPAAFKIALANVQNIMDYYFNQAVKGKDIEKLEAKKSIASFLLPFISKIVEPIEQAHYLQKLSSILAVSEDILRAKIKKGSKKTPKEDNKEKTGEIKDRFKIISRRLMALVVYNLEDFKYFTDYLPPEYLVGGEYQVLYKNMIEFYNQKGVIDVSAFTIEYPEFKNQIDLLSLYYEKDFSEYSEKDIKNETLQSLQTLEKNFLQKRIRELEKQLTIAESQKDNILVKELLIEINLLAQKLAKL